jgi:hypothetical protein
MEPKLQCPNQGCRAVNSLRFHREATAEAGEPHYECRYCHKIHAARQVVDHHL